ncbi:MAG: alanine--tRNA ligase [Alphaproteobacteria bacterium]
MLSVNEIRESFLSFFRQNNHQIISSSPLVPRNDPTLMFTTAGMVQFKNLFTGIEKASYTRAVSSQKCVRAGGKHNDLDNVGYTARHHTFFEMLGNFSFGDYFKDEAIEFAWNFITKELKLDKERLYITVYHNDNEAFDIWKKLTDFPESKIIRINTNDNFWSMGDTGPCGPCSEIFYDHGEHIFGGLPGTKDEDGDRFVEIWNLVFMQFEQLENSRIALPKPSIDTGMGLERISAVMQKVHNNYDIDIFKNLINAAVDLTNNKINTQNIASYRIIADHLRSCSFLIADGVMPSNEGRGYVLRRIMRRAMRHIHQLGSKDPLMHKLLPALIENMGSAYPELIRAESFISETLRQEEERFKYTLDKGLKLLSAETDKLSTGSILSGDIAFKLYDTYGFPLYLTKDIVKQQQIEVDDIGFNDLMKKQKEQARASWVGSGEKVTDILWYDLHEKYGATEFLGYDSEAAEGQVNSIIIDSKEVESISEVGIKFNLITNQTPFYAESGGQVGDIGEIYNNSANISVIDTKKHSSLIIHYCILNKGIIKKGEFVTLKVNSDNKNRIKVNHSATHLLHSVLREVIGNHVTQKGSLVTADKLRFDISHSTAITVEEQKKIEYLVNELIIKNSDVLTRLMPTNQAIEAGAMALFGEKYEDEVRVVSMGHHIEKDHCSTELCGGTHVRRTGDIGCFKIISEGAVAAGVRRIEAVTGLEALKYFQKHEELISSICKIFKSSEADMVLKIETLIKDKKNLEKDLALLRTKDAMNDSSGASNSEKIGAIEFTYKELKDIPPKDLRNIAENIIKGKNFQVAAIFTINEGKISVVIAVGDDLTDKLNASIIAKEVSLILGGSGGGGKPNLAQAGGVNIENITQAIDKIKDIINKVV